MSKQSASADITTVFVPNNALDRITRDMLNRLEAKGGFKVIIAGPGEEVEGPAIKSKLDLKAVRAYRHLLKQFSPDITFSVSTSGLSVMLLASAGLKIANIGYRGTQARVRRSDPFNYLAILNPRVRHVVCETLDIEQALGKLIGEKKVSTATKPYCPEWADEALENPLPYPGHNPETLKLITVGMFDGRPHKGLGVLLDAMKILADKPVELTVVGSTDPEDRKKAPESVTFTGPRNDALRLMPSHDLYVLPSLRDASPRTVREAQAVGVPCLVSDIPGARDLIIDGKTGMLVPPGNPQAIADAIMDMVEKRSEISSMGQNARQHIREHFSMDDYVEFHANLFEIIK